MYKKMKNTKIILRKKNSSNHFVPSAGNTCTASRRHLSRKSEPSSEQWPFVHSTSTGHTSLGVFGPRFPRFFWELCISKTNKKKEKNPNKKSK
jgi:hypothetical protein